MEKSLSLSGELHTEEGSAPTLTRRGNHFCTSIYIDGNQEKSRTNGGQSVICSCCRKRCGKPRGAAERFGSRNERDSGDAIDTIPSRECNSLAGRGGAGKDLLGPESHLQNQDYKKVHSKSDSINLLYDGNHKVEDNIKYFKSPCDRNYRLEKSEHSLVKKESAYTCHPSTNYCVSKNSSLFNNVCTREARSVKHPECNNFQACQENPNQYYHRFNHCRGCHQPTFSQEECRSHFSRPRSCHTSGPCLCPCKKANYEIHCSKDSHVCDNCTINFGRVSSNEDQKEEEHEDNISTIKHKDSLCILVEKYKANEKRAQRSYDQSETTSEDRGKEERDKLSTSEITYPVDVNESATDTKQREVYQGQDNLLPMTRGPCRRDRDWGVDMGDCDQIKNLKSHLIKSGNSSSSKGTPWRHTF